MIDFFNKNQKKGKKMQARLESVQQPQRETRCRYNKKPKKTLELKITTPEANTALSKLHNQEIANHKKEITKHTRKLESLQQASVTLNHNQKEEIDAHIQAIDTHKQAIAINKLEELLEKVIFYYDTVDIQDKEGDSSSTFSFKSIVESKVLEFKESVEHQTPDKKTYTLENAIISLSITEETEQKPLDTEGEPEEKESEPISSTEIKLDVQDQEIKTTTVITIQLNKENKLVIIHNPDTSQTLTLASKDETRVLAAEDVNFTKDLRIEWSVGHEPITCFRENTQLSKLLKKLEEVINLEDENPISEHIKNMLANSKTMHDILLEQRLEKPKPTRKIIGAEISDEFKDLLSQSLLTPSCYYQLMENDMAQIVHRFRMPTGQPYINGASTWISTDIFPFCTPINPNYYNLNKACDIVLGRAISKVPTPSNKQTVPSD